MTMKYKTIAYDSAKHILAMPDHYVSIARKATKATEAGGMVVKEGDRFIPFGMKGSRKLSDYFRDKKFTLYQKQKAYVLLSKNEIIRVIGERTSDKFRVDGKTTHILEIKCEK